MISSVFPRAVVAVLWKRPYGQDGWCKHALLVTPAQETALQADAAVETGAHVWALWGEPSWLDYPILPSHAMSHVTVGCPGQGLSPAARCEPLPRSRPWVVALAGSPSAFKHMPSHKGSAPTALKQFVFLSAPFWVFISKHFNQLCSSCTLLMGSSLSCGLGRDGASHLQAGLWLSRSPQQRSIWLCWPVRCWR